MTRTTRIRVLGLEMVAIVASILIAFALDAWWEQSQESRAEQVVLNDLIEQFEATRVNLADHRRIHLAGVAAVDRMLDRFATNTGERTLVPDSTIMRLYTIPTYDRKAYRLESLIQSGQLEVISDASLRDALVRWPGVAAEMLEHQLAARSIYQDLVVPHLLSAGDLGRVMINARRSGSAGGTLGLLNFDTGESTALVDSQELRGALAYLSTQNGRAAYELGLIDDYLGDLLAALAGQLK